MFKAFTRRAATVGVASVAILGLATGPAAAHFCFKTELQEQAAKGMAGSASWTSFEDLARAFLGEDLCQAAVDHLAAAGGIESDTLINSHGTLAGGTLKKGADSGTRTISHVDFEAVEAAIGDAVALCQPTSA